MMTREEFWKMADGARSTEQYLADKKLHYMETAPLDVLRRIFVQYRFFTIYYIQDLALLIYRVPFGRLRSTLGDILNEELGEGDPAKAHPAIYDSFLRSVGVTQKDMDAPHPGNIAILEEMHAMMLNGSVPYTIGLRGMGGECLCQIHLEMMHKYFQHNPHIKALEKDGHKIDWYFWEIHAGEVDQHHRILMRECLSALMDEDPSIVDQVAAGYWRAKRNYDVFWDNIFSAAGTSDERVVTTPEELAVFERVKRLCTESPHHTMFPVGYKDTANFFGINIGKPDRWFVRAFCDTERRSITTQVPVELASLLSPGFEVEAAPVIFGKSRVFFREVADLEKLRPLILHAYEEQAKHA